MSAASVAELLRDADERPVVFVTCGTDHHHFDRLVGAVDAWARCRPDVFVVVQHGATAAPTHAAAVEFLSGDAVDALMGAATVVVCSAGPGAVMDARRHGVRPVVMARRGDEAVDDHQQAFAAHLERTGLAVAVSNADDLALALDADVADPSRNAVDPQSVAAPPGIERIGRVIDDMVWGR